MKTISFFLFLILLGAASLCQAETKYISEQNSITFRSGPGTKHKILQMIVSGQPVEVLDTEDQWTKVRLNNGREGWVMSLFLTSAEPDSIASQRLQKEYDTLRNKFSQLQETSQQLKSEHDQKTATLEQTARELEEKEAAYAKLKKELVKLIKLKADYAKSASEIAVRQKSVDALKHQKFKEGLVGLGGVLSILLLGYIMGSIYRRNRQSSSLY